MKVIAISGMSGCGKTSVVKQLADFYSCPYLLFDDYVDPQTYPNDMKKWLNNGANVSEIKTPRLVSALQELMANSDAKFIFIEEPFGKCRASIASLIDYVVLLDIPMEVCLSRVIMRNIKLFGEKSLSMISTYLVKYESYLRDVYLKSTKQTRELSNLIISEQGSVQSTANIITSWLAKM